MIFMLNIDPKSFAEALRRELPGLSADAAMFRASVLIRETDSRLELNVQQWIDQAPITDCWVGKYCVNAIMAIQNSTDFIDALEIMNLYLQDPTAGELRIWRGRR